MATLTADPNIDVFDYGVNRLQMYFGTDLPIGQIINTTDREDGSPAYYLKIDDQQIEVVVRRRLTIGQLRVLFEGTLEKRPESLLLLSYSDEKVRDFCREQRINFIDAAGNAFVNLAGFHLLVEGVAPIETSRAPSRAFQRAGLKLLYAIDRSPEILQLPYGEMAQVADISKGAVGEAMADLKRDKFLSEVNGRRLLTNGRLLVERWAYAYLEVLRPTLYRGTFNYLGEDFVKDLTHANKEQEAYFSGTYAADRRGGYLRGFDGIVYTNLRIKDLRERFQLVPSGKNVSDHGVEVLFGIEPEAVVLQQEGNMIGDLILYADLIRYADPRVLDAAEKLFTNEIQSRFLKNGFQW